MTQPPVVPGPDNQPPRNWPAQPPASKSRGPLLWVVGAVGVLLLVGVAGGIGYAAKSRGGGKPAAVSSAAPLPQDRCGGGICNTGPVAEATTPRVTYTPTTADFTLIAKTTEKACFGSAGCNVTFRPDVTYTGTLELDPGITWLVVYDINGVEDAPQVGHLTVEGSDVTYDEDVVSTKSSKSKITLKVTSVEQQ